MADLQQALLWHKEGRFEQAESAYRAILDRDPANADACNLLGMLLSRKGEETAAESLYARAVARFPNHVHYLLNYASSVAKLGDAERSQEIFQRTLALQPDSAETNARYGLFLAQLGRIAEAEPYLLRSVDAATSDPALWVNLGNVQRQLGKLEEAVQSFGAALNLDPRNANAWNCFGEALQAAGLPEESIDAFRQAVSLAPETPTAIGNLGLALHRAGQLEEATKRLEDACRAASGNVAICSSLAAAYRDACRIDDAMRTFRDALEREPESPSSVSKYLYTLNFHPTLPAEEAQRAHLAADACFDTVRPRRSRRPLGPDEPLRVALLSGDFSAHSVANFLLHLLEDSQRLTHYYCYSEASAADSVNQRFRAAAAGWRETAGRSAGEIDAWMAEDGIDVLIDLAGHTSGSRLDAVAASSVPLALNWLGYPHFVGLKRLDGRIVDSVTDPAGADSIAGLEPLVRLPGCFLSYKSPYELPPVKESPCSKREYLTFGSFNNAAKLNDRVIAVWARILSATPESRLLLKSWQFGDSAFRERIRSDFAAAGADPKRIDFAPRTEAYRDHLSLYGEIDIALDPFPYNGTTTTCEALWMGVPVIALIGDRHASRVGMSLLQAAGLKELVAENEADYVQLAVSMAADKSSLVAARGGRRAAVTASTLGDTAAFKARFEAAIRELYVSEKRSGPSVDELLAEAHAFHRNGQLLQAAGVYDSILRADPSNGDALHGGGVARYALREFPDSERLLRRAAAALPNRADVLTHWGSALQRLGRFNDAIEVHERALEINPSDPTILSNYGNALSDAGRLSEALRVFRRSLDAHAENPSAWINYSVCLKECGRLMAALEAAREAVKIDAKNGDALGNLGSALVAIGEADEAVAQFGKAVALQPDDPWLWSNLIYALHYSDEASPAEIAEAVNRYGALRSSKRRAAGWPKRRNPRLRVGFVSADLRQHAVARFLRPLLRERGTAPIDIYLYCNSSQRDEWTEELMQLCASWRFIFGKPDAEVASLIEQDGVDLLIDLGGHSSRNRLALFAMRAAPLQATWLGFPGSTGLAEMDFRIADSIALTPEEVDLYPENPILLPSGYHTIAFPEAGPVSPTPSLSGKPFTFGSFNNLSKAGPKTIALWCEILRGCPGSRLLLKAYQAKDPDFREHLLSKFTRHGIERDRIDAREPILSYGDHLECYSEVDICLDPTPYHGTTTTCEALMMGVPTVTLLGNRMASRVGASLLTEVGLDAFICESETEYVQTAVSWAGRSEELNVLRQRIRGEFERSALGNASRFAKDFFAAIIAACESRMCQEEASAQARSHLPADWIEQVELPGEVSDGDVIYSLPRWFAGARFDGLTILDASCVDGYWAVECLRRDAKGVVCLPAPGFYGHDDTGRMVLPRQPYVDACRRALGVSEDQLRLAPSSIYEADPDTLGAFDWVLLNVNANQLRHPLLAFDALRRVCRERLSLSIVVGAGASRSDSAADPSLTLREGPNWIPNLSGLEALLAAAGFAVEAMETRALDGETVLALVLAKPVERKPL